MIAIIVAAVFCLFALFIYNSLIGKKNAVENAFASIDVQLKQRHDLIPNLVAMVKESMTHERSTLEKLVALRTQAMTSGITPNQMVDVENQITRHLSGIMVSMEAYPNLKANENVLGLQKSLNEVEAQIAAARRSYNSFVTEYNNATQMFPTNIFASAMGYSKKELLITAESERQTPNVKQLFRS